MFSKTCSVHWEVLKRQKIIVTKYQLVYKAEIVEVQKKETRETSRWGVCPSSSLLQIWLLQLAAKVKKIEGMCIGAGWDGINILILSCNSLVSWAKYPDVLNPNSPISYLQATTELHQISNVCFPFFFINFQNFLHVVFTSKKVNSFMNSPIFPKHKF